MSRRGRRWARIVLACALGAACSNAGADRVLTIPGMAQVRGLIYLDQNGDSVFTGLPDVPLPSARVRLVALGTVDTVARTTSDSGALFVGNAVNFAFLSVPVGSYRVVVDTLSIPHDSMRITRSDPTVTVNPGDTAFVRITVSFPGTTPSGARALLAGTKVWMKGVALANANTFGDSTNSYADDQGAILVTQIKPSAFVGEGDTDRVLGIVGTRLGQPVLRYVNLFQVGLPGGSAPVVTLTVGEAETANGGAADAGLVSLSGRVVILDTLTGTAGRIVHVKDTTASLVDTLEVHLDSAAQFDTTALKRDTVGARLRLQGILLPSGVPGRWLLKPRSPADQS